MKTITAGYTFDQILRRIAEQDPEERLRIAFRLNTFVKKVRSAGVDYAETKQRHRARRAA